MNLCAVVLVLVLLLVLYMGACTIYPNTMRSMGLAYGQKPKKKTQVIIDQQADQSSETDQSSEADQSVQSEY